MIRLFFNHLRRLLTDNQAPNIPQAPALSDKSTNTKNEDDIQSLTESLDSACAKLSVYIREDGEFAVTSEFYGSKSEEAIDASGIILHMINSGSLADYFLQSLHLWGEDNNENAFVIEIIKRWKELFDDSNATAQNNLAVDPSDVFALKSLKKDE